MGYELLPLGITKYTVEGSQLTALACKFLQSVGFESHWQTIAYEWRTNPFCSDKKQCLARGETNKQIARLCHISAATVKVHLKAILRKTNAKNRTQAAIWAIERGLRDSTFKENANIDTYYPETID
jgi:hypothetical protein